MRTPASFNPTNSLSYLGIRGFALIPEGNQVRWSSEPGKTYLLERSGDLAIGFDPVVQGGILATPPFNSLTDTNVLGRGPFFYRIRLEE